MSGHFKVKSKVKLGESNIGDIIQESDFACVTPEGHFVQLEYVEEDDVVREKTKVKAGIWVISKVGMQLKLLPTSFVKDSILEQFVHTKHITDRVDMFFRKLNVYYDNGIEVPKRGVLLYGPAGSGKTTAISKVVSNYTDDKTAVIVWHTAKFDAQDIKEFIQSFEYVGVERLIMIMEDVGGLEKDEVRRASDSSLLSLLDNQEKTFTIPVCIIATTNHPETLMGNLTNRPNRFDDKLEIGAPDASARAALLSFFSKNQATEEDKALLSASNCKDLTPAHIREVWIRSQIFDKSISECINEVRKEIEKYNKGFSSAAGIGMGL